MELGDKHQIELASDLARPGLQLSYEEPKIKWTVRPDAVVAESPTGRVACGPTIARVLRALPETPMQAVGNNFTFSLADELNTLDANASYPWLVFAMGLPGAKSAASVASLERGGALLNVAIRAEGQSAKVQVNVHRAMSNAKDAAKAAESFESDEALVRAVIEEVFQIQVERT